MQDTCTDRPSVIDPRRISSPLPRTFASSLAAKIRRVARSNDPPVNVLTLTSIKLFHPGG